MMARRRSSPAAASYAELPEPMEPSGRTSSSRRQNATVSSAVSRQQPSSASSLSLAVATCGPLVLKPPRSALDCIAGEKSDAATRCPHPSINPPYADHRGEREAGSVVATGEKRHDDRSRQGAGSPMSQLRRRPGSWLAGSVRSVCSDATLWLITPRARPVRLAAPEADGATARRKPLRSLRLDRAAVRASRRCGLKCARGSPHAVLALSLTRAQADEIGAKDALETSRPST
jgi:hypothetical protein